MNFSANSYVVGKKVAWLKFDHINPLKAEDNLSKSPNRPRMDYGPRRKRPSKTYYVGRTGKDREVMHFSNVTKFAFLRGIVVYQTTERWQRRLKLLYDRKE